MVPPSSVLAPNMENLRHWDSKEQDAADVVTHHSPLSPMDYDEGIAPDWSQATSKLYGRSNEEQVLLESYRRCISSSQELILITGHSGNGKTQLAKTLDKPEENMFLSGKFDVMQRSEPYKCFGQALTQWVEKVERRGTDVERIIRRIEQATDNGGVHQIIRQIAPGLSQLFPPATDMEQSLAYSSSMYAEKEILRTFCAMVAEMCSPEEPLVLFLDDLQWAEPASVDLLSALIRANIPGLVIVGACRGNEISSQHYFSCVLRELEADSVAITEIQLGNLEVDAVHEIICDLLSMPTEASNSLQMAEFLQRQTDGNIFFCLQLLRMLHEEGFLYAKYASTDSLAPKMIPSIQWTLDTHEYISSSRIPCTSTSSLLEDKLNAMDVKHRHVLQVACCLGAEFDLYLLSEIIKDNVIVENALNIASAKGLVIPQTHGTQWRFAHDSVQLAAYRLVEQGDPASFHLNLGRQLWSSLSDGELEMNLYLVADQYKLGLSKLESEDERNEVAGIFLAASKKGTSSSAFGTAAEYLETGISLLGNRHWRDQYDLSLELFNAAAENHHCCGNHAQVDNLIKSIQLHTRSFHDTLVRSVAYFCLFSLLVET
jgi:predicted ATPase